MKRHCWQDDITWMGPEFLSLFHSTFPCCGKSFQGVGLGQIFCLWACLVACVGALFGVTGTILRTMGSTCGHIARANET